MATYRVDLGGGSAVADWSMVLACVTDADDTKAVGLFVFAGPKLELWRQDRMLGRPSTTHRCASRGLARRRSHDV